MRDGTKVASNKSGFMAKRARTEAYTLVELMIVVSIIGIFAGLAAPSINRQLVERRTNEIQLAVVRHFREARSAAIGYGHAYKVAFSATASSGRGQLTFERGSTNRCANATFTSVPNGAYSPLRDERSGAAVKLTLTEPAIDAVELCFQPTGVMYWRPNGSVRFSDRMTAGTITLRGGLMFRVAERDNDAAVARRIVLPFGGSARVFQ
jgi:prepilin-type N-terminal cleavage/methylation domain-containing protein